MLQLNNIVKDYVTGTGTVHALKGIDLTFRESEFVSILGHSGCGKTTLLNIIGGLDRYTSGDLIIDGISTKDYADRDWDNYRNHSIGFIFQTYNLITHQSVLANVELALTLSGIGKEERRERAIEALKTVGLGDQIHKMPNQLSGGQMQRVAIARALINDPRIILADEPTGALDSETSVQIMELLKKISGDKLIIMVTHNPELAESYSSRIITLKDGLITGDTMPIDDGEKEKLLRRDERKKEQRLQKGKKEKKPSMSFLTALSLSLKNLLTKKGRTILTAFAGSIGIIGIALILAVQSGFQAYIDQVQEDTLSSSPIEITKQTAAGGLDYEAILSPILKKPDGEIDDNVITETPVLRTAANMVRQVVVDNDLSKFKNYLDERKDGLIKSGKINAVQYTYSVSKTYYADGKPINAMKELNDAISKLPQGAQGSFSLGAISSFLNTGSFWTELMDNKEVWESQYDLVTGSWSNSPDEVMLIVDKYNRIADHALLSCGLTGVDEFYYSYLRTVLGDMDEVALRMMLKSYKSALGFTDEQIDGFDKKDIVDALTWIFVKASYGNKTKIDLGYEPALSYSMQDFIGKEYQIVVKSEKFQKDGDYFVQTADDSDYVLNTVLPNAQTVKIVGIIRSKETSLSLTTPTIAYTSGLTDMLIERTSKADVVKEQQKDHTVSVLDGSQIASEDDYESLLVNLGLVDENSPTSVRIFPTSFKNKDAILDFIDDYNDSVDTDEKITYTDLLGFLMTKLSSIIDAISIVLICFVGISLVVSSIMISIITYISVLERTKEIGILRSIGASKKDISRVFNAETTIIGFISGLLGVVISVLLCFPINAIIVHFAPTLGSNIARLPFVSGIILMVISIFLTVIAGLIPSGMAAKKDPVIALRTE